LTWDNYLISKRTEPLLTIHCNTRI
jgi:hypothetical protein